MSRSVKAITVATMAVLVGLTSLEAQAQTEDAIQAAKWAVRRVIKRKLGREVRIVFQEPKTSFLSLTELVVSGSGILHTDNRWQDEDTFTYKLKARRDGSSTREVRVDFRDGTYADAYPQWETVQFSSNEVDISRPRWFERFDTGNVTFEGRCRVPVTIVVYDRNDREVARRKAGISGGRFRTAINLRRGSYHADVISTDRERDSVRFSVDQGWGDGWRPPQGGVTINIDRPAAGGTESDRSVTIAGRCNRRDVQVRVYRSDGRKVVDRRVGAPNGRWEMSASLDPGSYQVVADSDGKRTSRTFRVRYGGPGFPDGGGVGDGDRVDIRSPRNGEDLMGSRVTISGTSSARDVQVEVFTTSGRRVANHKVAVRNRSWSTSVPLDSGSYRVEVRTIPGSGRDSARFDLAGPRSDDRPSSRPGTGRPGLRGRR